MRKHCEKSAKKVQKQCETLVSAAKELPNLGGEAILHFFNLFSHFFALSLWKTLFFRKSSSAWENAKKCKNVRNLGFTFSPDKTLFFRKCDESVENVQKSAKPIGFSCRSGPRTLRLHFIRTLFTLYLHFICTSVSSQPLPLTFCSHFICTFLHVIYIFMTLSTRGSPQAYTLFAVHLQINDLEGSQP